MEINEHDTALDNLYTAISIAEKNRNDENNEWVKEIIYHAERASGFIVGFREKIQSILVETGTQTYTRKGG
jgi:hypothetical protein